jgi:hypothetical protein
VSHALLPAATFAGALTEVAPLHVLGHPEPRHRFAPWACPVCWAVVVGALPPECIGLEPAPPFDPADLFDEATAPWGGLLDPHALGFG